MSDQGPSQEISALAEFYVYFCGLCTFRIEVEQYFQQENFVDHKIPIFHIVRHQQNKGVKIPLLSFLVYGDLVTHV